MKWFILPRKPETEVMNEAGGVEAYASAAAQTHLDALDDAWVSRIVALGVDEGWALDIGCGPGQIPLKIAQRLPRLRVVGIDRSAAMLKAARAEARKRGLSGRVEFLTADASRLGFPAASFDLVISNSLLHHLNDPAGAFNEMARVAKAGGKVLVRDLRRPSRPAFAAHVAWHGRHYSGAMKTLFRDSVRAAYTPDELQDLLRQSRLESPEIFLEGRTHLGFRGEAAKGTEAL